MKKLRSLLSGVVILVCLSACAGNPMTAAEFRAAEKGSLVSKKTVIINRPYKRVVADMSPLFKECFSVVLQGYTTINGATRRTGRVSYTTTITEHDGHTEFILQDISTVGLKVFKEPEGGTYSLVTDVTKTGRQQVSMDLYYLNFMGVDHTETIRAAVIGWADGSTRGCPDLTAG